MSPNLLEKATFGRSWDPKVACMITLTLGNGSPGTSLQTPTGYTMIRVQATPAAWFWVDRGATYRMAEVVVRCEIDVDVTLI